MNDQCRLCGRNMDVNAGLLHICSMCTDGIGCAAGGLALLAMLILAIAAVVLEW